MLKIPSFGLLMPSVTLRMETDPAVKRFAASAASVLVAGIAAITAAAYLASLGFNFKLAIFAIAAVQPLAFAATCLMSIRLAIIAGPPARIADAFWTNVITSAIALAAPPRLTDAAKPVIFNLLGKVPFAHTVAAVTVERLFDVAYLCLLTTVALLGATSSIAGTLRVAIYPFEAILITALAVVILFLIYPPALAKSVRVIPIGRLRGFVEDAFSVVRRVKSRRILAATLGISLAIWVTSYLIFVVLIATMSTPALTNIQILIVFVAATIGFSITFTPAGLGTYEAAIVLSLRNFGYPFADALTIALAMRFALLLSTAIPAAAFAALSRGRLAMALAKLWNWRPVK